MTAVNTGERLGALEQRVTGMEKGLNDVAAAVTGLSTTLQTTARTPWGVIWAAMGVCFSMLSMIGALVFLPMREAQSEIKAQLQAIVPRVEHERIWDRLEKRDDTLARRLERIEDRTRQLP